MKFFSNKSILVLVVLSLLACRTDNKEDNENSGNKNLTEAVEEISESDKYLEKIKRAHNASKFAKEEQVKFKLKLDIGDDVFFDGFVTLKTNGSKARFLDSNIDRVVDRDNISTTLDKKLYWLAEIYTIGFWLEADNFKISNGEIEEYSKSIYKSPITSNTYTIYSHPLTDVIQYVEYITKIPDQPFNSGTVYFDKYITVNRVPVSLAWEFKRDNEIIAKAEITRISYPDVF